MHRELQHTHMQSVEKCVKWFTLLHQVPCDVPVRSLIVLGHSSRPLCAAGRRSTLKQIALIYTNTQSSGLPLSTLYLSVMCFFVCCWFLYQ